MFKKKQETTDLAVIERQIYNLTKLVHINSMINSTLDMGRLLTVIMETIKDIMETEASTLLLYEEKSDDLVFKVALGEAGKELTERYRIKLGQGIA
nr:serine/threonine protein phosphatase [Spirochaetota bacterium]